MRSLATRPDRDLIDLRYHTVVPAPLDGTFAFFADAGNLQRLTPPWLQFSIRTPTPLRMRVGLEIDYRLRLYGVPLVWRSRIDVWEAGICFVDRQVVGPYLWWRHEHRFQPTADGTRVIDHVEYLPRAAWLTGGRVRHDVERIFRYRQDALRTIFDVPVERHDG